MRFQHDPGGRNFFTFLLFFVFLADKAESTEARSHWRSSAQTDRERERERRREREERGMACRLWRRPHSLSVDINSRCCLCRVSPRRLHASLSRSRPHVPSRCRLESSFPSSSSSSPHSSSSSNDSTESGDNKGDVVEENQAFWSNPVSLIGWIVRVAQVDLDGDGDDDDGGSQIIGEVVEVIERPLHAGGVGHALLNMRTREGDYRLLPFVQDFFPYFSFDRKTLYLDPPQGLLDLDSEVDIDELKWLKREIQALFSKEALSGNKCGLRQGCLPCKSQLEQLERGDLQDVVDNFGGHFEVAAQLGLRPWKKPPGYWDADSIELEIANFLESFWVAASKSSLQQQQHQEENTLTGELRLVQHQGEGGGGDITRMRGKGSSSSTIAMRLLPNSKLLVEKGRHDLVYAIKMNGGFKATALELNRMLYSTKVVRKLRFFNDFDYLAEEIRKVMLLPACLSECPEMDKLPTQRMVRELKRHDIDAAIAHHGGYFRVAQRMDLKSALKHGRGYWRDVNNVLREIENFTSSMNLGEKKCPSYAELEKAGRYDLKYGVEVNGGRKAIIALLSQDSFG